MIESVEAIVSGLMEVSIIDIDEQWQRDANSFSN